MNRAKINGTVKFAVVGAGHMGANHIKKVRAIGDRVGARVSAIVEPDELRAAAIARDFAGHPHPPEVIANIGDLSNLSADNNPDAAIIAVPASIHKEATLACLDKGLHCLVEKPLGFSAMDCRELGDKARKTGKVLQVGLLERWSLANLWGSWRPERGSPWTIHAERRGPFVPRAADTDVIHDLMVHDLDLFCLVSRVFGLPAVKDVSAWGRRLRSDSIDQAFVSLHMEDGGEARFFASRLSAESSRSWEMTGPDWHASIDFMRRSLKRFEKMGRDQNSFIARENSWSGGDPLGLEIEAFVNSLRGTYTVSAEVAQNSFDFCRPEELEPDSNSALATHDIIDRVLSAIKVLG